MKNIVVLVVIVAVIITSMVFIFNSNVDTREEVLSSFQNVDKDSNEGKNIINIDLNGDGYEVAWIVVDDVNRLNLIPNFDKQLTSQQAIDEYDCKNLVNGGFYSKEELPIGLFVSEKGQMQKFGINRILNGVFYVDRDDEVGITRQIQDENYRLALQSGPILIQNGNIQRLDLANDKKARRMVVGVTSDNKIIFLAVYSKGSYFVGPYLEKLPEVVDKFEDMTGFGIINAINLDGGAASVFFSDSLNLTEISMVGSFFCIK